MFHDSSKHYLTKGDNNASQWKGLGLWNLYFIFKLFLYWTGHINLHIFYNIFFSLLLVIPLRYARLRKIRDIAALPAWIVLLYHDSWFPPLSRIFEQSESFRFSNEYLLEIVFRFINWEFIAFSLIILIFYFAILRKINKLTVLTFVALFMVSLTHWSNYWVPYLQLAFTHVHIAESSTHQRAEFVYGAADAGEAQSALTPDAVMSLDQVLDKELAAFYEYEQDRRVSFGQVSPAAAFDIVFINICSLSWDDLRATKQLDHQLFAQMDIIFERFNAATSYSSPAVLRLLRANCGQQPHANLYEPTDNQ